MFLFTFDIKNEFGSILSFSTLQNIVSVHIQIIKISICISTRIKYTSELHLLKYKKTCLRCCYEDFFAQMLGYNILSNVDHIVNSI